MCLKTLMDMESLNMVMVVWVNLSWQTKFNLDPQLHQLVYMLLLDHKGRRLHNGLIILTLLSWWPRQWVVTEPACHKCQTLWQFLPHKLTVPIVLKPPNSWHHSGHHDHPLQCHCHHHPHKIIVPIVLKPPNSWHHSGHHDHLLQCHCHHHPHKLIVPGHEKLTLPWSLSSLASLSAQSWSLLNIEPCLNL